MRTLLATPALILPVPTASAITRPRLWVPRRVLVAPDALKWEHGRAIAERSSQLGSEIIELKSNRLTGLRGESVREEYASAKTTLALVAAPPSARKLQPIPPSADWQFHIAEGCPAHCQYCYLAGSLPGPPVTRVYANLPEILGSLPPYLGQGRITSASAKRAQEGTTFECSCYTDPLALEHLTGSLRECIRYFGAWEAPVQLRWTTKFDGVQSLLGLPHGGRTRVRFSVNGRSVVRDFEGGTASIRARLQAMRSVALAGYPIGLTVAPIMPVHNWREQYTQLLREVRESLAGVAGVDLTAELITHRFTPKSKLIQLGWYPKTTLDFTEATRAKKTTKFGTSKFVYTKPAMQEMRCWFERALADELPQARLLYWT